MKSLRYLLTAVLLSLTPLALAQSDAQKSFDQIKALSGTWTGAVTMDSSHADMGNGTLMQVTMRVTSRGNALVHEMKDAKSTDDPTKFDHPVSMFYLDNGRLLITHYCDAGNRPRMAAKASTDSKKVEFDFLDVAGSVDYGHMNNAVFTIVDNDHHTEEWTYMMPGDKPVHARMDLTRAK